jgi:hypothetical protein
MHLLNIFFSKITINTGEAIRVKNDGEEATPP